MDDVIACLAFGTVASFVLGLVIWGYFAWIA